MADDDKEQEWLDWEKSLETLYANLSKLDPSLMVHITTSSVRDTLSQLREVSASSVWASLRLFHRMGEAVSGVNALAQVSQEPMASVLAGFLNSDVCRHPSPAVSLVYFDVVVRYSKFLEKNPKFLKVTVASFLDKSGLRHRNGLVRSHAIKCFGNFLIDYDPEAAKSAFRPFVEPMVKGIVATIEPRATRGMTGPVPITHADMQTLVEALARLIGSPITGAAFSAYFGRILALLGTPMDEGLKALAASRPDGSGTPGQQQRQAGQKGGWLGWISQDPALAAKRFSQAMDAVSSFIKPLASEDAGKVQPLLKVCLEKILRIHALLPAHPQVRAKTVVYLHHMVGMLGEELLPYLPRVLAPLIKHTDPSNIVKLLVVVNQCLVTFQDKFVPTLDVLTQPLVARCRQCIEAYSYADQSEAKVALACNLL